MSQLDGVGGSSASASDAMRTFRVACDMHEGAGCGFAGDLLMQVCRVCRARCGRCAEDGVKECGISLCGLAHCMPPLAL